MTWIQGAVERKEGRERQVLLVRCNGAIDCLADEVIGKARTAEEAQRLLVHRGWTFDTDGRDFCPKHSTAAVPA